MSGYQERAKMRLSLFFYPLMRVVSFRLINYKSFYDSGELGFNEGFNILIGPNNVGKSSLLEGIALRFGNNPHVSERSKPSVTTVVPPISEAVFSVECEGNELRDILLKSGGFRIPVPEGAEPNLSLLEPLFSSQRILISASRKGNDEVQVTKLPSFASYQPSGRDLIVNVENGTTFTVGGKAAAGDRGVELGAHVGRAFRQQVHFFEAQRFHLGEHEFGRETALSPTASNLPQVLNVLQSNRDRFQRFNSYVSQIFPTVRWVGVEPSPNASNRVRIIVWSIDPSSERQDLAIDLHNCGTGLSQVIAILYVAVTSSYSRVIVIDEPNSFLHPGAAKKLVEILRGFPQLQYIVATHSSEIVQIARPRTLSAVRWSDGMSTVEQIQPGNAEKLQLVLHDIGVVLGDVFGADRVLWVEGATEETCFRILIEQYLKRPLVGTAIAAIRDTGRLATGRPSSQLVWDIYI